MQFSIFFGPNLVYYHFYKNAPTVLIARVGAGQTSSSQAGHTSSVTLPSGDTVRAHPGQSGYFPDGGDGYCGGGGFGDSHGGRGGTDGGNGHGGSGNRAGSGGRGNGEEISNFTFTAWKISAGAGERILILAVATAVEGGACWWTEKDPKPVNTMVKASGVAEAGTVTIVRGCQALSC